MAVNKMTKEEFLETASTEKKIINRKRDIEGKFG